MTPRKNLCDAIDILYHEIIQVIVMTSFWNALHFFLKKHNSLLLLINVITPALIDHNWIWVCTKMLIS